MGTGMEMEMEMHWLSGEFSAIMGKTRLAQRIMKLKLLQKVFGDRYDSSPKTKSQHFSVIQPSHRGSNALCRRLIFVFTCTPIYVYLGTPSSRDALISEGKRPPPSWPIQLDLINQHSPGKECQMGRGSLCNCSHLKWKTAWMWS